MWVEGWYPALAALISPGLFVLFHILVSLEASYLTYSLKSSSTKLSFSFRGGQDDFLATNVHQGINSIQLIPLGTI